MALLKKEYGMRLKAAADFMWNIKEGEPRREVKDIAGIYQVDTMDLHNFLLDRTCKELREAIEKNKAKEVSA